MDKLKMQTPDLTDKNIEQIAALFPNVITETKDENGNLRKAVDFDLLKQSLSKNLVETDDERYRLDWPGKKASLLKANTPITKTLRPCREESVNFDTTENLYIEGDNFEVLKILQESYLGKVKMIYIDPPYNTGNDFIYKDDFKKSKEAYEEELGVEDEEGGKLFKNTDSNGRFHSDWLSMMYERLIIARDLLAGDGLIAVSIHDTELFQLGKILDEIFGEGNKLACAPWLSEASGGKEKTGLRTGHEYLLIYYKNSIINISQEERSTGGLNQKDINGPYRKGRELMKWGGVSLREDRPNQFYPLVTPKGIEVVPYRNDGKEGHWRWGKNNPLIVVALKDPDFFHWELRNYDSGVSVNGKTERWVPYEKIRDIKKSVGWSTWLDKYGSNADATRELKELFDFKPFDTPKPTQLIKWFINLYSDDNAIVLDFFSGSAATAHAVMQLNAEDNGNRKFIMVQLPEKTDENSEAYQAGYKTIAEIGKERIRRAGKKIIEELTTKNTKKENKEYDLFGEVNNKNSDPLSGISSVSWSKNIDIGFRVYKTADSNMKNVFYHPSELKQEQLSFLESNIEEDRTPEDLLTQVILDLGLELSLPIETKKILGNTVFIVQTNALVACFDNDIDFKIIDTIADLKPFKVVFKDAGFKDDKDRINVEERFKRLSPETKVMVI
ncbi:MAG: site-specific DNA-methyltransferase [Proteobacteria bacterium]|nr:site-specific DNA-methyltransferase [Pseudomonadota bacterium]